MTRIIALVNSKGGVGKTTSTINLGAALAKTGKRVLLVDIDPQASLTYSLGIEAHNLEYTILNLLKEDVTADQIIIKLPSGYSVLPSNLLLANADLSLAGVPGREKLLQEGLGPIKGEYDYILIDCPPSLGILTQNGLCAASEVFITLQTEYLALLGMDNLLNVVANFSKRLNPGLSVTGIIGTMYDSRKNLSKGIIENIKDEFGSKLFNTLIRTNVALAEAPAGGVDIFTYSVDSNGAKDYIALAFEVIEQEVNNG